MKIVVNRLKTNSLHSTISTVEVNDKLRYYGMEPINPIPEGTYELVKYWSPAHDRWVPLVKDVPGHEGIEIHTGNFPADTKDCLLLAGGTMMPDAITSSSGAVAEFCQQFFGAVARGEKSFITYKNIF